MARWLLVAVAVAALAGCGSEKQPGLGNNRNNVVVDEDMGTGSIFPDVTINNNTPIDMSTPDLGTDMSANPPDMSVQPDLGPDLGIDMGVDMGMQINCPQTNVPIGSPCKCNQECTSGTCVDASTTESGFCTTQCTQRSDCPVGETCVTDRFGASVCRVDDTGANCTAAGQPTPDACSTGHCVQAGSNFTLDYFCSVPCASSTDCQMGHACTPVRCQYNPAEGYRCLPTIIARRAPNTAQILVSYPEPAKLCVKVGDPNPCGAVTMASDEQACPGSMCDASPTGRCTAPCTSTSDCPSGGCVDYDVSDPTLPVRVCDL